MLDEKKLTKLENLQKLTKEKDVKKVEEVKETKVSDNEIKLQIEVKEKEEYIKRLENIVNNIDIKDDDEDTKYIV